MLIPLGAAQSRSSNCRARMVPKPLREANLRVKVDGDKRRDAGGRLLRRRAQLKPHLIKELESIGEGNGCCVAGQRRGSSFSTRSGGRDPTCRNLRTAFAEFYRRQPPSRSGAVRLKLDAAPTTPLSACSGCKCMCTTDIGFLATAPLAVSW